jgi:hypothetical protein
VISDVRRVVETPWDSGGSYGRCLGMLIRKRWGGESLLEAEFAESYIRRKAIHGKKLLWEPLWDS